MTATLMAGALAALAVWSAARAASGLVRVRILARAGATGRRWAEGDPRAVGASRRRATGSFWIASWAGRLAMCLGGVALGQLLGGPPVALCGGAAALAIPKAMAARSRARRASLLEEELAEAVGATAAALRSGLSLSQSI